MVPNIWRISLASCQGAKQSREATELCFFDHLNRVYTQCMPHTCDQAASAFQKGWCNLHGLEICFFLNGFYASQLLPSLSVFSSVSLTVAMEFPKFPMVLRVLKVYCTPSVICRSQNNSSSQKYTGP